MVKKKLSAAAPELAAQWHPTKNGDLKPEMVGIGDSRKVWWLYPHDDSETGKHFDFEWEEEIRSRYGAYYGYGYFCPFLTKRPRKAWPGFNDLATINPELAAQWHPTKNGNLKPTEIIPNSNKKVWWLYPYDDPETGKHFDFEWEEEIKQRHETFHKMKPACPFISGLKIWPGFNDLATINPELAAQWHPTKNGNLTPKDVSKSSGLQIWWLYPYDDPKTGKHYDFEWEATISNRTHNPGCPFISGQRVWTGFNDLATTNPELAAQWHPTKNGNLKPTDITSHNDRKVWWLYPYDDPETGKHYDFEWEAIVYNRINYPQCPFLTGRGVWTGFNDLATTNPELAAQWHPTKNGSLKPNGVSHGSNKKVWWQMISVNPVTEQQYEIEWQEMISARTRKKSS